MVAVGAVNTHREAWNACLKVYYTCHEDAYGRHPLQKVVLEVGMDIHSNFVFCPLQNMAMDEKWYFFFFKIYVRGRPVEHL